MSFLRAVGLAISLAAIASAAEVWTGVDRIVAVGDVHGDYEQFTQILKDAELVDDSVEWVAGGTHFVQTGDVPDR